MIFSNVLFLSLFLTVIVSVRSLKDDIAIIRQRVLELTVWPPPENIPMTVQNALNYSSTLNNSCYWPDINYKDQSIVVWNTEEHMFRITVMLQALTCNGSTIRNNSRMIAQVHCALNVWLTSDWTNPNWWFNQIGIPLQATSQLLMLGDNATSFEIEKITEISYRACWWLSNPFYVGANLVWMIQSELYRSLATNNRTGLEQGFTRMWQDVVISNTTAEGIQYDWSYHFHYRQLLSASYGVVWSQNILLFIQCSQDTQYQPNDDILSLFADFLNQGDAWMIMTNEWDWHAVGRGISNPGNGFAHGFTTDWIRSLAQLVKSNESRSDLINFANRLDNRTDIRPLIGNRHFFQTDYHVHRRTNWIFTIKMQSSRTRAVECILGQNLKAEHVGQGVLNLYRTGFNDYQDIFPIIDWQAINGITVEHDIPLENCTFDRRYAIFVGGVSDSQYGLAYADTATHNLTAQRSWHFYDDAVIALATSIKLNISTTPWTTLASRLLPNGQISIGFFNSTIITLNDGNYSFLYHTNQTSDNVQWIHLGDSNIGYILPLPQQYSSVGVQVGVKTGNYDSIGPFHDTVTARMVTLFLNHGPGPFIQDYNYMIVPNVSLESMPTLIKKYQDEQVFACISTSTNNSFHGTMWPTLKRAAFISWINHTTTFSCSSPTFNLNITLTDAGAFLYSETETDFTLTASHPTRGNGTVEVIVDRVGSGEGCTLSPDFNMTRTKVTLLLPTLPEYLGSSVNVTCKK